VHGFGGPLHIGRAQPEHAGVFIASDDGAHLKILATADVTVDTYSHDPALAGATLPTSAGTVSR
jgi:hypothetical protein